VEATTLESYLADYQKVYGPVNRFSIVRPDFYTRFLLSTDFFQRGGDAGATAEPLRYVRLYEPTLAACFNPLTQPPSDEELARGNTMKPSEGNDGAADDPERVHRVFGEYPP
jgi:hypothetical protein